jgi:hypothetical protein
MYLIQEGSGSDPNRTLLLGTTRSFEALQLFQPSFPRSIAFFLLFLSCLERKLHSLFHQKWLDFWLRPVYSREMKGKSCGRFIKVDSYSDGCLRSQLAHESPLDTAYNFSAFRDLTTFGTYCFLGEYDSVVRVSLGLLFLSTTDHGLGI